MDADISHTLHRQHDQPTSIAAAQAIAPKLTELQEHVLAYAHTRPDGFTDHDLARDLGDATSTLRTRRAEMTRAGKIVDSGKRVRVPGRKREFILWRHAKFGGAS